DTTQIQSGGSKLEVRKSPTEGNLFSTLVINEFNTDQNAQAVSNGITISRRYLNQKDPWLTVAVGDVVEVELSVSGTSGNREYGVIRDYLPSGFVPVNPRLDNQRQRGDIPRYSYHTMDIGLS